jgi:hypothetical protein
MKQSVTSFKANPISSDSQYSYLPTLSEEKPNNMKEEYAKINVEMPCKSYGGLLAINKFDLYINIGEIVGIIIFNG